MTSSYKSNSSLSRRNTNEKQSQFFPVLSINEADERKTEDGLDLGQVIATLRRRALVIAGMTAAVTSAALFWSTTRAPNYQGNFQLLIEPVTAESQVISLGSEQGSALEGTEMPAKVDYDTQISVLISPKTLLPVVDRLQTQIPEISYVSLTKKLQISRLGSRGSQSKILVVSYQDSKPENVQFVLETVAQAFLNYSLRERQTNLSRAIRFADKQISSVKVQVQGLEQQLQNFRQQYGSADPGAQVAQLSGQMNSIEQQEQDNEIQLSQKRTQYNTLKRQLELKPEQLIAASVLKEAPDYQKVSDQLQEVQKQIVVQSALMTDDHPALQSLKEQEKKLLPLLSQKEQKALGSSLSASVPNATGLPYQNTVRMGLINQFVQTSVDLGTLEARQKTIAVFKSDLNQRMKILPTVSRQYDNIQSNLKLANTTLANLLARNAELQLNAARQEVPWELISPPTLPQAVVNSVPTDLALGALLGLLLGVGTAFLLDKTSRVIYTPRDLKLATQLPVLGMIPVHPDFNEEKKLGFDLEPFVEQVEGVDVEERPRSRPFSPFLEAFRSLNTNIRGLDHDPPVRSLVISSVNPAEGKSTISIHLAQAAAAMGQRVLLVDADLRNPQIHSLLDLAAVPGLCDVASTGFAALRYAVQQVPNETNFFVLSAGRLQPDATRLLASSKVQYLMQKLHENFDLVIYDTPPIDLADASILATHTDGLILVTKLGAVDHIALNNAIERLGLSRSSVLGIVANGVRESSTSSANYKKRDYAQAVK
jgi:polysaccharide biosynthesis transport protein